MTGGSPFLDAPTDSWLAANRSAFALSDQHPVSQGHSLVAPRRLICSWWDLGGDERDDIFSLVDEVKILLDARFAPDGYNVGFNVGAAAGQTVDHLHVHIIPRYDGDVRSCRPGRMSMPTTFLRRSGATPWRAAANLCIMEIWSG